MAGLWSGFLGGHFSDVISKDGQALQGPLSPRVGSGLQFGSAFGLARAVQGMY